MARTKTSAFYVYLVDTVGLAPSSAILYERHARRIRDSKLTPAAWLKANVGKTTPRGTANTYSSTARHLHRFFVAQGRVMGTEPKRANGRKKQQIGRPTLTPTQLEAYTKKITKSELLEPRPGIRTILLLLPWTGLRIAEATSLHSQQIEKRGNHRGLRVVGKGNKERWVPLGKQAERILRRYISEAKPPRGGWLFPSAKSEKMHLHPHNVRHWLNLVRKSLGPWAEKLTPHTLRHTFATRLLRKGVDIKTVQTLLGHENIATTSLYLHPDEGMMASAIEQLGDE